MYRSNYARQLEARRNIELHTKSISAKPYYREHEFVSDLSMRKDYFHDMDQPR